MLFKFQSSPARGGGCNLPARPLRCPAVHVSILTRPWGRVQPDHLRLEDMHGEWVSILTRPWGRVQHADRAEHAGHGRRFNPHPPVGAGATPAVSTVSKPCWSFNPHPPVGAGATVAYQYYTTSQTGFNPHPPVGAGATRLGERAGAVPQTQVFQLSRCAVPRSGRLTAAHSPTDTRYAASRPWAGCPLAPSSR